ITCTADGIIDRATAKAAGAMLRSADDVLTISKEQDFALWVAFGNVMRGWCLGMLGQSTEGIALLLEGLAGCRTTGCGVVVPFWLAVLAELYGHAGQPQEGLKQL